MSTRVQKSRTGNVDYPLLVTVVALVLFGLIAVWATSVSDAMRWSKGSLPFKFVVDQATWLLMGTVAAVVAYAVGYRFLARISTYLMVAVLLLLVAVFVVGDAAYGSYRRLEVLGLSVQPSEIAKPIMIIYLARWLASKGPKINDKDTGLIPFLILVGLYVGLIMFQPNLSTAIILGAVAVTMFLMAGADLKRVGLLVIGGFGLALMAASAIPYQRERILGFLFGGDSGSSIQKQMVEDLTRSAGIFGQGLTNVQAQTEQTLGAHMDFIFAFVTYGFGVFTALLLVAAFLYLGYRAVRIAQKSENDLGTLIGAGIGSWLLLQALIHVGVNLGALPITGMTLPFVSYGGTSLLASLVGIGVLLSVSRDAGRRELRKGATYPYGGRNRRPRVSSTNRRTGAARKRAGR